MTSLTNSAKNECNSKGWRNSKQVVQEAAIAPRLWRKTFLYGVIVRQVSSYAKGPTPSRREEFNLLQISSKYIINRYFFNKSLFCLLGILHSTLNWNFSSMLHLILMDRNLILVPCTCKRKPALFLNKLLLNI